MVRRTRTAKAQELAMEVLRLKAVGGSVPSISKELNISPRQTRKTLDFISNEIRDGLLSDFVAARIPLNLAEHLELNRIIVSKAMGIAETATDNRVKIEGLRLASQVSAESAKTLSDANMIGQAVRQSALVVHEVPNNGVIISEHQEKETPQ